MQIIFWTLLLAVWALAALGVRRYIMSRGKKISLDFAEYILIGSILLAAFIAALIY